MKLLNIEQAAERLNLKPATITRWVFDQKISVHRVGRRVMISEQVIDEIINKGFSPAKTELVSK